MSGQKEVKKKEKKEKRDGLIPSVQPFLIEALSLPSSHTEKG